MASEQANAIKEQLKLLSEAVGGVETVEEQRAQFEMAAAMMTAPPEGVIWTEVDAGGVAAIWADAEGGSTEHVIQYVHGGGYKIGSATGYRNFTGQLAKAVGCRVLSVDYRLAPEHPHPAAVNDSTTAYRWLLDQGYSAERIAISGDSAGGGLTLSTLLNLRDNGVALPVAGVPISPWVDLEGLGESMITRAEVDVLIDPVNLKEGADVFLAGHDARDPLAAPLYGDFTGISPLLIQVGDEETLLDDSTRMADVAASAGVDVSLEVFPEMQHVFQLFTGNMPEADDAVAKIAAWLRPRLGL
ncbi:MAG: alpha/beta hydrolase [Acidimicrobiia bacterium]|nr:alpha/beta hydrolase [Actinomycetota bacterium]MBL6925457.1 alpha/beta hydrolase [Acidimicrobiia bacterium]